MRNRTNESARASKILQAATDATDEALLSDEELDAAAGGIMKSGKVLADRAESAIREFKADGELGDEELDAAAGGVAKTGKVLAGRAESAIREFKAD